MNKFLLLLISFLAMLSMSFHCGRDYIAGRPFEQSFEIPVDIYPLKKTYSLTDTVWIETDITGKSLFDKKSNQLLSVDTGQIDFGASFNVFGTQTTNPAGGFCDIYTIRGVNTNKEFGYWGTSGYLDLYGCGQATYKGRIGFKPLIKGTYWLILANNNLFGSCPNKVVPYYADISYRYKAIDLGLDVFNAMTKNDKGGNDGIRFYTEKINNREVFVFKVE